MYLVFFGTRAVSTRYPKKKKPFAGLWRSARCGRLSSREVWASTSFRSSSRQRLHWAGPGSIAPCAMCGWLRASESDCVRASAVSTLARTHCYTAPHAHSLEFRTVFAVLRSVSPCVCLSCYPIETAASMPSLWVCVSLG